MSNHHLLSLAIVTLFGIAVGPSAVDALARLINVPLTSVTTQGTGQFGQPTINYFATITVGTPAKSFRVQFDVNTNELFLPHYSWNPFNRNLHYSDGFQCKVSSTCVKHDFEYKIEYQHVTLAGKRYEDLATLSRVHSSSNSSGSQAAGLVSFRQNFLAISSASDGRFAALPIDGFFGLGPATTSVTGVRSLLDSLHKANLIDNLQFSFWFNPVLDHPNGGTLVLGGVDTSLYQGQIFWHPLVSEPWQLKLQAVSLGQQMIACAGAYRSGCQARFSTGLSDIYGPREDVVRLYSWLNTTKSPSGHQLIDCRRIPSLPYITFNIDGIPYYLPASNYVRKTLDGGIFKKETCYVAIMPSDDDAITWILSTPFLGAYYSIFDSTYRQIGFAALK